MQYTIVLPVSRRIRSRRIRPCNDREQLVVGVVRTGREFGPDLLSSHRSTARDEISSQYRAGSRDFLLVTR
jgi:hypothetical protein